MSGRPSVFKGKDNGTRLQGVITREGAWYFERHRKALSKIYKEIRGEAIDISDADVIEYLSRGEENTRQYLTAFS